MSRQAVSGSAEHLRAVNRELPGYEQVAFVAVVGDAWLPENGFSTPTLKEKRARIEAAYRPVAEGWYDQKKPVVWAS